MTMKKTLALKPGDPVTCMSRYYNGAPYHGEILKVSPGEIEILFGANNERSYEPHGGYTSDDPCSLIPGHITPEPLTLPETVEFEQGDRVLAWGFLHSPNNCNKMPGIYIERKGNGHRVRSSSGNVCNFFHVEPFTEEKMWAQFVEIEDEQPADEPEPETDEPKEGDWCAFWDNDEKFRVEKYRRKSYSEEFPHTSMCNLDWRNARKLKPSDLSPELWAIIKNEETK